MLLDHNLPFDLRPLLHPHEAWTTRYKRWDRLGNGLLLRTAADDGFDGLLTIDKNMEHQQNLSALPLPILQMDARSNRMADLVPFVPFVPAVLAPLATPLTPALDVVGRDGSVRRLTAPRA